MFCLKILKFTCNVHVKSLLFIKKQHRRLFPTSVRKSLRNKNIFIETEFLHNYFRSYAIYEY